MSTFTIHTYDYNEGGSYEISVEADAVQPLEGSDNNGIVFYNRTDGNTSGEIVSIHYGITNVTKDVIAPTVAPVTDITGLTGNDSITEVANA